MLLFFGIYVAYTAILSLTAFFARIHTIDMRLGIADVCKAISLCAIEVSCRAALSWPGCGMTALIG